MCAFSPFKSSFLKLVNISMVSVKFIIRTL